MMRARVGAQFATLLTFVAYAGMSNFDFRIAPMYQDAKKAKKEEKREEKQEDKQEQTQEEEK